MVSTLPSLSLNQAALPTGVTAMPSTVRRRYDTSFLPGYTAEDIRGPARQADAARARYLDEGPGGRSRSASVSMAVRVDCRISAVVRRACISTTATVCSAKTSITGA